MASISTHTFRLTARTDLGMRGIYHDYALTDRSPNHAARRWGMIWNKDLERWIGLKYFALSPVGERSYVKLPKKIEAALVHILINGGFDPSS